MRIIVSHHSRHTPLYGEGADTQSGKTSKEIIQEDDQKNRSIFLTQAFKLRLENLEHKIVSAL